MRRLVDFNGNVAAITDGLPGQYGDRDMIYDALDRLTSVGAGAAQGGDATFAYDPLDNIRVLDQGARQYRYSYSATTNQLSTIKNPAGSTLFTFGHDIRGNQTARTGATFTWDRADRMTATSLGTSSYVYDGLGRRVKATANGLATDSYYGRDGALLFQRTPTKTVNYVRLAGSLVAERSVPIGGGSETRTFQHTDALGTPVLETNASGAEITGSRERMTAYGEPADGGYADGPGYTGHVTDAASKLTYMQQRYYDPVIGRFLSIDPVATDANSGSMFNRYRYADNNPFKFVDPDGRAEVIFTSGTSQEFKDDFNAVRAKSEEYGMSLFGNLDSAPGTLLVSEGNSTGIEGGMYKGKVAAHLFWDPDEGAYVKLSEHTGDTGQQSPAMGLVHEVGHAVEYLNDPTARGPDGKLPEESVINGPEREWGESAGEPVRSEHGGVPIENKDLFQHE